MAGRGRRVLRRVHERRVALGRGQRRHVPGRPLHADLGALRVPARARPRAYAGCARARTSPPRSRGARSCSCAIRSPASRSASPCSRRGSRSRAVARSIAFCARSRRALAGTREWLDARRRALGATAPKRAIASRARARRACSPCCLAVTGCRSSCRSSIDRGRLRRFPAPRRRRGRPGLQGAVDWYHNGEILDFASERSALASRSLTWALPLVALFARAQVLPLAVGARARVRAAARPRPAHGQDRRRSVPAGALPRRDADRARDGHRRRRGHRRHARSGNIAEHVVAVAYWMRTVLAAIAAALVVLVAVPGSQALGARVRVLERCAAQSSATSCIEINAILGRSRRVASRSVPAPRTTGGTC